jgi:hypothetical protein
MDPPLNPPLDELTIGLTSDESSEHPYTPADVSRYFVQPRNVGSLPGFQSFFRASSFCYCNTCFASRIIPTL